MLCVPPPKVFGVRLTLDAEAELLLLVGDVAGDGPDECHGQGAGNAGNRPCLRHCRAQRERGAVSGGTRTTHPIPPHRIPAPAVVPTSTVVVIGVAAGTCKRHKPISGPVPLWSPRRRAGQPGREWARRGGVAARPQGQPWAGGESVPHGAPCPCGPAPPPGAARRRFISPRVLKPLRSPTARAWGEPPRGTPLPAPRLTSPSCNERINNTLSGSYATHLGCHRGVTGQTL